jgi:hypothetical protein
METTKLWREDQVMLLIMELAVTKTKMALRTQSQMMTKIEIKMTRIS